MLHVILDRVIFHRNILCECFLRPIIAFSLLWCALWDTKILIELTSVDVTVIDMEDFPEEFDITSDLEIINCEIYPTSISSENLLAL